MVAWEPSMKPTPLTRPSERLPSQTSPTIAQSRGVDGRTAVAYSGRRVPRQRCLSMTEVDPTVFPAIEAMLDPFPMQSGLRQKRR